MCYPVLFAAVLLQFSTDTRLKTGCEPGDSVIAEVAAGATADVRMSVSTASGRCFKVQTTAGTGWVPASTLTGIEQFDAAIRTAFPLMTAPDSAPAPATGHPKAGFIVTASQLLSGKQPKAALELLEQNMKNGSRPYDALVLAGIAANAADDSVAAAAYLEEAQRLRPDPSVERLLASVLKQAGGDKSSQKLVGGRFLLRFEEGSMSADTARQALAMLDAEYSRVAGELGCRTSELIVAIVQSPKAYRASTDAAEWSGGLFDGHRIRVPLEGGELGARVRAAFTHEIVHACLAAIGDWPAWLHEGVAQKLSGHTAPAAMHHKVRSLLRQGKLPTLANVSQAWSRMSPEHASMAYAYALVAVETLYAMYPHTISSMLRNPAHIPRMTAELDRVLIQ
jgi:hypothetical protein